jgi:hypothetical protein
MLLRLAQEGRNKKEPLLARRTTRRKRVTRVFSGSMVRSVATVEKD